MRVSKPNARSSRASEARVPRCRCAGVCRCAGLVPFLLYERLERESEFFREAF